MESIKKPHSQIRDRVFSDRERKVWGCAGAKNKRPKKTKVPKILFALNFLSCNCGHDKLFVAAIEICGWTEMSGNTCGVCEAGPFKILLAPCLFTNGHQNPFFYHFHWRLGLSVFGDLTKFGTSGTQNMLCLWHRFQLLCISLGRQQLRLTPHNRYHHLLANDPDFFGVQFWRKVLTLLFKNFTVAPSCFRTHLKLYFCHFLKFSFCHGTRRSLRTQVNWPFFRMNARVIL